MADAFRGAGMASGLAGAFGDFLGILFGGGSDDIPANARDRFKRLRDDLLKGAVRWDEAQDLTPDQKTQGRENIGAAAAWDAHDPPNLSGYLRYDVDQAGEIDGEQARTVRNALRIPSVILRGDVDQASPVTEPDGYPVTNPDRLTDAQRDRMRANLGLAPEESRQRRNHLAPGPDAFIILQRARPGAPRNYTLLTRNDFFSFVRRTVRNSHISVNAVDHFWSLPRRQPPLLE